MRHLIVLLFFLSGAAGLVYEVLWAKYLALILGSTALAHTIVLATFLGGLALGNSLFGPRADRTRDPLRLYGRLELGIALLGALSPMLVGWLSQGYVAAAAGGQLPGWLLACLRVVLSAALVGVPATLMGGTLPTLSRFAVASLAQMEASVSRLYFINSAGASLGALFSGFLLIPNLGLDLSIFAAAALNLAVGTGAILLSRRAGGFPGLAAGPARRPSAVSLRPVQLRCVYAAVFLSGFVSLGYEIAWIRLLSLVLGSSVYSFSLMLSAFIAGIALGGWLVARGVLPHLSSYILLGACELAAGLSLLATLPFYERLPHGFHTLGSLLERTPESFYLYEALKFLLCFVLMLVPTAFLGATLPLASRIVTQSQAEVGRKVGRVFGLNTLGNLLGAAAAGLVLLPRVGIKGLFEGGIFVNLALGTALVWTSRQGTDRVRAAVGTASLAAYAVYLAFFPAWDKVLFSLGEFRNDKRARGMSFGEYREAARQETVLYYKDGSDGTVAVLRHSSGNLSLRVNGKTDASSGEDLQTQILLGQTPLILKPDAQDVLVVGLGSGVTAGTILRHPIERLDLVEISPAVVEASSHFRDHNHSPLKDPRLRLHLEDAKTFLQVVPRRYDIVISEPSNPWVAGMAGLFTTEFHRCVRSRLREGGLAVQWFHLYEMTDDTLRLILRTFASEFEHVTLWNLSNNDIFLIGSAGPPAPDFRGMEAAFRRRQVREDLRRIGIESLATVLSFHAGSDGLVRRLGGRGRLNEDRFPVLEYEAPKAFFLDRVSALPEEQDERMMLETGRSLLLPRYLKARGRPLARGEWRDLVRFHGVYRQGIYGAAVREWAGRFPSDREAGLALARLERSKGRPGTALSALKPFLKGGGDPDSVELAADLEWESHLEGRFYLNSGGPERALRRLRSLLGRKDVSKARVHRKMSDLYAKSRRPDLAMRHLAEAARQARREDGPLRADALWVEAAGIAAELRDFDRALALAKEALSDNPENSFALRLVHNIEALREAPR